MLPTGQPLRAANDGPGAEEPRVEQFSNATVETLAGASSYVQQRGFRENRLVPEQ